MERSAAPCRSRRSGGGHAAGAGEADRIMTEVETYRAEYLAPLPSRPRARGRFALPVIDARYCYLTEGQTEARDLPLLQLYTGGVECGHTDARAALRRRICAVDSRPEGMRVVPD